MKLNPHFFVHLNPAQDDYILVPDGSVPFSGIVRGNKTFGAVLEQLKTDVTEEEIAAALQTGYGAPEDAAERDVKKVLTALRKIGALVE